MNVSLPETMAQWVEDQVSKGMYGTASELFRDAIRELQQRRVREQIDAKLLTAMESGESIPVTPEFWQERQRELTKHIRKKRKA